MVIWLLGVSGAGKTTLGTMLKTYLDSKNIPNCIIDGDIVRNFYNNDLGYTKEDRVANIKRILLSAYLLEQNGIIPIVCNISPFQELRDFAKEKLKDYVEIYLKRNLDDIHNKDTVYNGRDVVGVDVTFEEPRTPSLIINTSTMNAHDSLKSIIQHIGL